MLPHTARPASSRKQSHRHGPRLNLESLEARDVPSFTDGFEAPTLDPFWNDSFVQSGNMSLTTARAHSGSQSLQFTSTSTSSHKNVRLSHNFSTPTYGQFSVRVFDTGADVFSSNYLELAVYDRSTGSSAHVIGYDYDLGPSNGGNYYVAAGGGDINSGVDRTQGWHEFTIDTTPDSLVISIDGQVVHTRSGMLFDQVALRMFGPNWRPAWTGYFDDFEFVQFGQPDIAPTSLTWDMAQGGVDFGYQVTGADLTGDTTAALYWAGGPTLADAIGGPVYETPVGRPAGTYGPLHVPDCTLGTPPDGATHLLLAVDPPGPGQPDGAIDETDEGNNLLAVPIPAWYRTGTAFVSGGDLYVRGTAGDDEIRVKRAGHEVAVTINGGSLGRFAPTGQVLIHAGCGDDVVRAQSVPRPVLAYGEGGNDVLHAGPGSGGALDGGPGDDYLCGGPGSDSMTGADGNDTLVGGNGDDALDGGAGDDRIEGGNGDDVLRGGAGFRDILRGGNGDDVLDDPDGVAGAAGGNGDDDLMVRFAPDWTVSGTPTPPAGAVSGGNGDDVVRVTSDNPVIRFDVSGGNGNDRIELYGTYNRVRVSGGNGADALKNRGIGLIELSGVELLE